MTRRAALAFAGTAFVVALVAGTLGAGAASRPAAKAASKDRLVRSPRGPRGFRGPAGLRGPRGFVGAPGVGLGRPGFMRTLVESHPSGRYSSIAIGADGLPLITYDGWYRLRVAHCENIACTSAVARTVETSDVPETFSAVAILTSAVLVCPSSSRGRSPVVADIRATALAADAYFRKSRLPMCLIAIPHD